MNIDRSTFIPTIDSFRFHIPLTSTPKRSKKSISNDQPLSSTLSLSMDCSKQLELSISAITLVKKALGRCSEKQHRSNRRRRRSHVHPSTIIKRIELKYLLYSTRTMKTSQQRQYKDAEMKIYVI